MNSKKVMYQKIFSEYTLNMAITEDTRKYWRSYEFSNFFVEFR